MEDLFGNPSSSHIAGLRARSILKQARTSALRALGAESGRIVFTSGATEAIQTAVFEALEKGELHTTETLDGFRDCLVASLRIAFPNIVFNMPFELSVPTTINFSVPGLDSKEILDLFDAADIRVSSGSACGSALVGSYVLEAMGLPRWRSDGAVRLSFGPLTTAREISTACRRIEEAGRAMRGSCLIVREDHEPPTEAQNGLIQLKRDSMCSWIYVDGETSYAIIVDPFAELADRIETIVRCQDCKVLAILNTHMHLDHESWRDELMKRLDDLLAPSAHTTDPLGWPRPTGEVKVGSGELVPTIALNDRDVLARVDLPGHTVVGYALLLGAPTDGELGSDAVRLAFTGDTILIGGIGRTDFDSSSSEAFYHSICRLGQLLGSASVICPTHDYTNGFATTLDAEKATNHFLTRILDPIAPMSLEEFSCKKPLLDDGIDDETNSELVCGNIAAPCLYQTSLDVAPEDRRQFFEKHRGTLIIDVREPHEFGFVRNWRSLGLPEAPLNVPLTRIAEFLHELLAKYPDRSELELICLCRSGGRSTKAVELFRRCGVERAWNLTGGVALGQSACYDGVAAEYEI